MTAHGQGINNGLPYKYVVGVGGNYPKNSEGLQAAINDAYAARGSNNWYTVFILPTYSLTDGVSGLVNVPSGGIFIGSQNEMPADAVQFNGNIVTFNDGANNNSQATTVMDASLLLAEGGSYKFYNLFCYFENNTVLVIPATSVTTTVNFYNCWVKGNSNTLIGIENTPTGDGILIINSENSYIMQEQGYGFFMETNTPPGTTGSTTIKINARNSVIGGLPSVQADIYGVKNHITINAIKSDICVPMVNDGDITGSTFHFNFEDCRNILIDNFPFVDSSTGSITLSQQNVNYIAAQGGFTPSANPSIYGSITDFTLSYDGSNPSKNITLTNCHFSDDATTNTNIISSIAGLIDKNGNISTLNYGIAELKVASIAAVDLNVTTKTALFTVPTGKTFVPTKIVTRNASASLTTAIFGFGFNSTANDVIIAATHTALTGNTLYSIDRPISGAKIGAAADVFGVKCSLGNGTATTVTIDVYGYFI